MDVWFDSGTSWSGVLKNRGGLSYPADVYLEGSDQHRGWFQSSLLTSVASQGKAPFKTVLTHGFVLDEKGLKMSKSLGNVIDPLTVIEGGSDQKAKPAYGADTLRLWVAGVDYSGDVCVGENIMKQVSDSARKLRNTLRFLVGSLTDFDPVVDLVQEDKLPSIDRYTLAKLSETIREVQNGYDSYQFFKVIQLLTIFTNIDISAFYVDIAKDRLYISKKSDFRRKSCQTVIFHVLDQVTTALAPILPHMAEDLWQNIPYKKTYVSVFQKGWIPATSYFTCEHTQLWDDIRTLKNDVNKCIELARQAKAVGASQECKAVLHCADPALQATLTAMKGDDGILPVGLSTDMVDDLRFILLVSQIEFSDSPQKVKDACPDFSLAAEIQGKGVTIGIKAADGKKCERCWYFSTNVGHHHEHDDVCLRCADVLHADGHHVTITNSAQTINFD